MLDVGDWRHLGMAPGVRVMRDAFSERTGERRGADHQHDRERECADRQGSFQDLAEELHVLLDIARAVSRGQEGRVDHFCFARKAEALGWVRPSSVYHPTTR